MGLRIVMLGGPGAGKGTQAKRMSAAYSLPHISTGDIFRAHLREGTPVGLQVRQYLDSGGLVPDELTCKIVADRICESDCSGGYILDGFPRSLPQAEEFQRLLASRGEGVDLAINVDVTDAEIVDRLSSRRSCPKCGAIYNLKFGPPKKEGICDVDGDELIQRVDDKEETIRERLRVYHETTEPIIAYYEKQGILKTVSGTGSTPETVFGKIEEILKATGAL
jgi:adenylate kinase